MIESTFSEHTRSSRSWTSLQQMLLPLLLLCPVICHAQGADSTVVRDPSYPESIHLRASILTNTVPLAFVDESLDDDDAAPFSNKYQGFQPELLREIIRIAKAKDNITLTVDLEEAAPFSYSPSFFRLASDCNQTNRHIPLEECHQYDILIGDYYGTPSRSLKTHLTPALLTTGGTAVKYVHRKGRDIATFAEAEAVREPICLLDNSFFDDETLKIYPNVLFLRCYDHQQCLQWLKAELCVLFVEDELQLKYLTVQDPEIEIVRERFQEQYVLWPMNRVTVEQLHRDLFMTWVYESKIKGIMDDLHDQYFSVSFCPVGSAGADCNEPCNPSRGISDRFGTCVCDSTRWTGADCSIRVEEDSNSLSTSLVTICYAMVAINFFLCGACGIWVFVRRKRAQVQMAQPFFLMLILLGCVISTSTIIALAQEDPGDGPVHACMAIPWLYSVGFSITFGTLFAKIRRIYVLLQSAADMRRVTVSVKETFLLVGGCLLIDVVILAVWTAVDPLEWTRRVISADKYGYVLESEGYCQSDNWVVFSSIIGAFHFILISFVSKIPATLSNYCLLLFAGNLSYFCSTPALSRLATCATWQGTFLSAFPTAKS